MSGAGRHANPDHDAASQVFAAPRLELDELLVQLIDRAQDVMSAHERLGGLLAANTMIIGDLTLPVVLRRIVEAACQLVDARYGALGVIAPGGGSLEAFIHVGVDDATAAQIGHLPSGKGLLGALLDDPVPIRTKVIADDVRSVGFPAHHPPMSSFLGVPVRVRNEVYGNLYLTEARAGEFTADDEELVTALAATAGVAIDNARLFEQGERRQQWLQASMQITRQLLAADGEEPLSLIVRKVREIAAADIVTLVLPTPDQSRLMVEVAAGERSDELIGYTYPYANSLAGMAYTSGRAVTITDATAETQVPIHLSEVLPIGPVLALPLVAGTTTRGALVVGRIVGRHVFDDADLDMAMTFANHAALALELADARAHQQRVAVLEDRDRIARDLHDHVIQRLFAAGLTLESVSGGLTGVPAERVGKVVTEIDETIRQIRTSIFKLRGQLGPETGSARSRVLGVIAEVAQLLSSEPRVRFTGPLDSVIPDPVVDDLVAVTREALTNVARHARATAVEVSLTASAGQVSLAVSDNGIGLTDNGRRSGLDNMRIRAEKYGGTFTTENLPSPLSTDTPLDTESADDRNGTYLLWTIPLP
jgi:signal transduction histidine kinase